MSDIFIAILALEADQSSESEQAEPPPLAVIIAISALIELPRISILLLGMAEVWDGCRKQKRKTCSEYVPHVSSPQLICHRVTPHMRWHRRR